MQPCLALGCKMMIYKPLPRTRMLNCMVAPHDFATPLGLLKSNLIWSNCGYLYTSRTARHLFRVGCMKIMNLVDCSVMG